MPIFRLEHDAKIDRAFERWVVEAPTLRHATAILYSKYPDLDWDSGRFVWSVEQLD